MVTKISKKISGALALEYQTISYFVVGILSFLYFLGLAKINPDPHHDGVQFAAAVGVADGLKIHSEVYEQYGPVTGWIQGATLKLFGSTLLNLRLENVVLLTIAALLLMRIFFILRVPNFAAGLITLVWAVSCPVSSIYPGAFGFWPWSSVFALVLLLDNAAVLLRAQVKRRSLTSWELMFAGVTCGVLIFTRFQVGIIAVVINLLLIYLGIANHLDRKRGLRVRKFMVSLAVSVLYFVLVLAVQGSWTSFVDQIIVGPIQQYVRPFDWEFFKIYYVLASLPTLALLLVVTSISRKYSSSVRLVILGSTAGVMALLMYFGNWGDSAYLNRFDTWRAVLDVQGVSFQFSSVIFFLILSFFALCYLFSIDFIYPVLYSKGSIGKAVRDIYKFIGGRLRPTHALVTPIQSIRRGKLAVLGTLLLLEIPFLVQLYPIADVYHLWWVAPLFMVLVPYFLFNFVSRKAVTGIVVSLLAPALVSSSIMFVNLIKVPRSEIATGALKGMQVESKYVFSYANISNVLSSVAPNSARFYCGDGLLATWNGEYSSIDASYVSWAWVVKNPPTKTVPSRIFFCGTQDSANAFVAANGLRIVGAGVPYQLSYWSAGILFEFSR